MVKTSFVLASGERASAINIITYVDQDTFRWQSTNREIAGELQPNIPEVTVVRKKVEHNTSKRSVQEDSQ
jgi:tRNA A37 threonylcarbamoyladenosine dehydratase